MRLINQQYKLVAFAFISHTKLQLNLTNHLIKITFKPENQFRPLSTQRNQTFSIFCFDTINKLVMMFSSIYIGNLFYCILSKHRFSKNMFSQEMEKTVCFPNLKLFRTIIFKNSKFFLIKIILLVIIMLKAQHLTYLRTTMMLEQF